ncbi:MAG: glycosyltransferase [Ignavibacteria bacterium]|nr:glycosyltransferase [Ignavibacteria bacterium]
MNSKPRYYPKLNILFLTPRFPYPLIGGDHVKCYYLVKHLATQHNVTLVTFNHGGKPTMEQVTAIEQLGVKLVTIPLSPFRAALGCFRTFFTHLPLEILFYHRPEYKAAVEKLFSEVTFDVVFCFFMRTAEYVRKKHVSKILVAEDCRLMYQERSYSVSTSLKQKLVRWWEVRQLRKYEPNVVTDFDRTTLVTHQDIAAMKRQNPTAQYRLLTNGVNLPDFTPNLTGERKMSVLFAGKLDVWANELMIQKIINEIAPRIHAFLPDVEFEFVGANPTDSLRILAKNYTYPDKIHIHANVPSIIEYYQMAGVFLHPHTGGSGIQNKLLEAMACGCPVVTTSTGIQGIPVVNERDVLIGEHEDELAAHVVKLLKSKSYAVEIATNARMQIEKYHSWNSINSALDEILDEVLAGER